MKLTLVLLLLTMSLCTPGCVSDKPERLRHVPPGYTGNFETWWNDTQVRERGHYQDGMRQGRVTIYHPDGSLESSGDYEADVPVGEMRYHSVGGGLRLVEIVHDGVLDGPREEYDRAGRLRVSSPYVAGRHQGLEQRWHANGTLSTEGHWSADLPVGPWRHWDPGGRLLSVEWFWVAGGQAVGYLESTLDPATGRVTAQSLKTLHDQSWIGWRTFWHDNGTQSGLVDYVDGLRQGRDVSWDRQGRKIVEGQREDDLRSGTWRFWDEDGQLVDQRVYVAGEATGSQGSESDSASPSGT